MHQSRISAGVVILAALALVAALHLARDVLVPLALAALVSFALTPPVVFLRRSGLPRAAAVPIVVVLAVGGAMALTVVVLRQAADLAQSLPNYEATLREKLQALRSPLAGGALDATERLFRNLARDDGGTAGVPAGHVPAPAGTAPVPAEMKPEAPPTFGTIQRLAGLVLHPLATAGIALVAVIFILMQREELRDRLIKIAGGRDLERATTAMMDAGERLSHFLLTLTLINAAFGVIVWLGLWAIGVPNPALWGICAALLRFIPYVGGFIAAAMPVILAAAVDPGWSLALWTLALFLVTEPLIGHFLEPWLQGRMTGLSPMAILVAAIFWTWVWGPIGLVLATPMTVVLVVVGRHVPSFFFLDVLLGDEPALTPDEGLYQRLLAGDADEASRQAEQCLRTMPALEYMDGVLLGTLAHAHRDLRRGVLPRERLAVMAEAIYGLMDEVADHRPPGAVTEHAQEGKREADALERLEQAAASLPADWRERTRIVAIGGRSPLDTAAARALGALLARGGIRARIVEPDRLSASRIGEAELGEVEYLFVSYLDAGNAATHLRFMTRRLRHHAPRARIIACLWNATREQADAMLAADPHPDDVVTSLGEALSRLVDLLPAGAGERRGAVAETLDPAPRPAIAVAMAR